MVVYHGWSDFAFDIPMLLWEVGYVFGMNGVSDFETVKINNREVIVGIV